jgi:hypothetical protein
VINCEWLFNKLQSKTSESSSHALARAFSANFLSLFLSLPPSRSSRGERKEFFCYQKSENSSKQSIELKCDAFRCSGAARKHDNNIERLFTYKSRFFVLFSLSHSLDSTFSTLVNAYDSWEVELSFSEWIKWVEAKEDKSAMRLMIRFY